MQYAEVMEPWIFVVPLFWLLEVLKKVQNTSPEKDLFEIIYFLTLY